MRLGLCEQIISDEISHALTLPFCDPPAKADQGSSEKSHYQRAFKEDMNGLLRLTISKKKRDNDKECEDPETTKPDCHEDACKWVHVESSVNPSPVREALERTIEEGNEGVPDVFRPCCEESESVAAELYKDRSLWGRSEGVKGEKSGRRILVVAEA